MRTKKQQARSPFWFLLGAGVAGYALFLRPQMIKWGTRLGESQRRLPGDDIIPRPNFQMTAAIDIDAPPEALWPWLAQMGRERTGYYGQDMLTNWGIPSVTFIRQDIDPPVVGAEMDGGYHIMEVEPGRKLLFGGFSLRRVPGVTQDTASLYLLERRSDGSTRLLVRRRAYSYGALGIAYSKAEEIVYFLFIRQQLETLKGHAESMAYLRAAPPAAAETAHT